MELVEVQISVCSLILKRKFSKTLFPFQHPHILLPTALSLHSADMIMYAAKVKILKAL